MIYNYTEATTRLDFLRIAYNAIQFRLGYIPDVLAQQGITGVSLAFSDIEDVGYDQYYAAALYCMGIIKGVGNDLYEPNRTISRQEAAVMLSRIHRYIMTSDASSYSYAGSLDVRYSDDESIADWAFYDVYNMRAIGVMQGTGDNRFDSHGVYTHEQSIITFKRVLDY